jgi:queuine tRNA-ribosyltransferase
MGVGMPLDIVRAAAVGIDMFDCVLPTRMARNGTVFTPTGRLTVRAGACKDDPRPIQEDCPCPACRRFSRAYIRHLFNSGEIMGPRLATLHNLTFYATMMHHMREAALQGRFAQWQHDFETSYQSGG